MTSTQRLRQTLIGLVLSMLTSLAFAQVGMSIGRLNDRPFTLVYPTAAESHPH